MSLEPLLCSEGKRVRKVGCEREGGKREKERGKLSLGGDCSVGRGKGRKGGMPKAGWREV